MGSVANLVDAMLVFACGIMLALIAHWNIQLPTVTEVLQQSEVTEVNDVSTITNNATGDGTSYTELGTVYKDPTTGKLYMLTEDIGSTDGSTTEGGD